MHMDHDKNVLCDGYIVDFINDASESYYERGKHGYMHLNNIKFPLFMLKFLKFHSFCLPMLATLCFVDLFFYKIILHRKWVRLKFVLHLLLDALLLRFNSYTCESIIKIIMPILMAIKNSFWETTHYVFISVVLFLLSLGSYYFCNNLSLSSFCAKSNL